jgi:cytoskeleton protein RodZ
MAPTLPAEAAQPGSVAATPAAAIAAPAANAEIMLHFIGDSWVDIVDRQGAHIERGVVPAGAVRKFASSELAEVTLGDSTVVEVSSGGAVVDLRPFREAKVAHFTVSSEGRIGASGSD